MVPGAIVGSVFNFNYLVGGGNRLTEITYVVVAYRTTGTPTNVTVIDFFTSQSYVATIANL